MKIEVTPDEKPKAGEDQPLLPSTRDNQARLAVLHQELETLRANPHAEDEEVEDKAYQFCQLYFQMEKENELNRENQQWMTAFRIDESLLSDGYQQQLQKGYKRAKEEDNKAANQDRPLDNPKPAKSKKEDVKIDNKTQLGFSMSKKGQSPSLEVRGNIAVFQEQLEKYCKENNIPLKVDVDKESGKKTFIVNLPPDRMASLIENVQTQCEQVLKNKFPNDANAGIHPQRRFVPNKHASRWQSAASVPRPQAAPVPPSAVPAPQPAPQPAASSNMPRLGSS